jgi:hypothetical protein
VSQLRFLCMVGDCDFHATFLFNSYTPINKYVYLCLKGQVV